MDTSFLDEMVEKHLSTSSGYEHDWLASSGLPPLLTVKEVATFLQVHPQTVYRKIRSGEIKADRIGRGLRIARRHVSALTPVGGS